MPPARRRTRFAASAGFAAAFAVVCAVGIARGQVARDGPDELLAAAANRDESDVLPIERVVRFSISGNDLAVASDFKLGDGQRDVRLQGFEGVTRVEIGQRPRGRGMLMPYFRLKHPGDTGGPPETSIEAQGGRVTLTRRTNVNDVQTSVTLYQDDPNSRNRGGWGRGRGDGFDPRPFVGEEGLRPDRVRLNVRVTRPSMPAADEVRVSAVSFTELLRRHPGTTARHLGPLFRQFGQDAAVFRVEDRVAWQLFPGAVDADQTTASKVIDLVDRLDDEDFRAREQATSELELLGGPAMLILGELDRSSLNAEQNTRIEAILARYSPLAPEEAEALLDDAEFLLRCFTYSDVAPIRAAAAKALANKLDKPLSLDPAADPTRRAEAADTVRDQIEPE
jgi:hypothetical protein